VLEGSIPRNFLELSAAGNGMGEPMMKRPIGIPLRAYRRVLLVALSLATTACGPLTREEAEEAVDEAKLYSQAASLIGSTVEISENFSIGSLLSDAVENLRIFYASQMPCAATEVRGTTLTIEFGVGDEPCLHKGMRVSGLHEVTISRNESDEVVVEHAWVELSNGEIEVSGTAVVTWAGADDPSRSIDHELSWTRLSDGRSADGRGRRLQRPLDSDIEKGFTVAGEASWEGESGLWELTLNQVEMRWNDPVPQAGSYRLETPFDKSLTLDFERTAPNLVKVTGSSGRRSYTIDVRTPE
jgi:hypothetical protein